MRLWIDIETRSPVPIKHGVMAYAQKAEIILHQWAIDDGPVHVEEYMSRELFDSACQADEIWAHNAEFDRTCLNTLPFWVRDIPLEKWRCTAALARMHGLPGGLDKLCEIFKLPADKAKDQRGHWLIRLFCIPREDGKYNTQITHPSEWQEFREYGDQDVIAMREVWRKCPRWNATPRMWAVWHLDQRMNRRGVAVDLELAAGAVKAMARADKELRQQCHDMTDGELESTTQRDKMLAYLSEFDVHLPDLRADTVERALEDEDIPEHLKELLRVRQQASRASTAKYRRVLTHQVGGRLRNLLAFCGAFRTGRWAGRTFQPQNLPRPRHEQWDIEEAIARFRAGDIYAYAPDDVPGLASSALRGLLVAGESCRLVVSDFANIEGRDMAWLAGERWKLDAFAAYDAGKGPDLYKVAYARAFNVDPSDVGSDSKERQIGKVMELALQYYGGVGAFCSMAAVYGLDLDELAASAWPQVPAKFRERAAEDYEKAKARKRTYGLEHRVWKTCHALVLMWRAAHPAIVKFWRDLEASCAQALAYPGELYQVGEKIFVDRNGNWLRIRLPSGRYLCYPSPKDGETGRTFLGVNPRTRQWARLSTYSGKLTENIVQAVAADHMMDALIAAEEAGFNPVLSVHDEAICEPPDEDEYSHEVLSKLMVTASPWAQGLPLAAKGFVTKRYRK